MRLLAALIVFLAVFIVAAAVWHGSFVFAAGMIILGFGYLAALGLERR